jgi:hypothetical protein
MTLYSGCKSSAAFNAYDGYGWILPALVLTILLIGVLVLIASAIEGLAIDVEIFQGIGGIFKWTRRWWSGDGSE